MNKQREVHGPPEQGYIARVKGRGIDVHMVVENALDMKIIQMAMEIAERRRYPREVKE